MWQSQFPREKSQLMNTGTLRSSWWYMLSLLRTLSLVHQCASCNAWDVITILIFTEITECSLWAGYSSQTFWEYTEIKDSGLHDQHPTPTPTHTFPGNKKITRNNLDCVNFLVLRKNARENCPPRKLMSRFTKCELIALKVNF